jgi:toxin ParE1/3/4
MKILWTDPAVEDLRNLHSYIAKDSEVYAGSFVERIILAVEKLTNFPRLGRVVPEAKTRRSGNSSITTIDSFIASTVT